MTGSGCALPSSSMSAAPGKPSEGEKKPCSRLSGWMTPSNIPVRLIIPSKSLGLPLGRHYCRGPGLCQRKIRKARARRGTAARNSCQPPSQPQSVGRLALAKKCAQPTMATAFCQRRSRTDALRQCRIRRLPRTSLFFSTLRLRGFQDPSPRNPLHAPAARAGESGTLEPPGDRTRDPRLKRPMLYRLS